MVRSIKHTSSGNLMQYTMVCSYVASNSVLFADGDTTSTVSNKKGSSTERRMECRIVDEASVPLLNCECFGLAASG